MPHVERAVPSDREDIERLIAAYHASEGLQPRPERISWTVDQILRNRFPGVLLVARENRAVVGVVLAVYQPSAEHGRVLGVHDLYVDPAVRRRGIGRALAMRLLEEAKAMRIDRVDLEALAKNDVAATFWRSLGFRSAGREVYGKDLA